MEWIWYIIAALGAGIGFGTGFVGTGGGMMMLVVFTAFLGMELKTAVGTSTFIVTEARKMKVSGISLMRSSQGKHGMIYSEMGYVSE